MVRDAAEGQMRRAPGDWQARWAAQVIVEKAGVVVCVKADRAGVPLRLRAPGLRWAFGFLGTCWWMRCAYPPYNHE
jgi:hypothetical protein